MIMVPTVLPFFLDACAADSSACKALTHLCCSGEAYPKYIVNSSLPCLVPMFALHGVFAVLAAHAAVRGADLLRCRLMHVT